MTFAEFLRAYQIRYKNIAWLFGAGTSVSAGLPSASDLIWEFKRLLYCTEEGRRVSLYTNLANPAIRDQIQSYFNSKEGYPLPDSLDEYSFYFEKAYPAARDRADFLQQKLNGMQNSFGHKVLGVMMKNGIVNLIFTTNFDKAFENAAVGELKHLGNFFVASLDNTEVSLLKYHSGLRPFITKIHGDYFSERLKNTSEELQQQDSKLRSILSHACTSNGLAVMGYSGRDSSVMQVLHEALSNESRFPYGIFWFVRPNESLLPQVQEFILNAKGRGVQVECIEIETFDTAWAEIAKCFPNISKEDNEKLNSNYFRIGHTPILTKGSKYPIIRFNAVKILEAPLTARLLRCDVGNTREVKDLIRSKHSEILAVRKQSGVVGFGSDEEFKRVFESYNIAEMGVYPISDAVLSYEDSSVKGMILEALSKALARDTRLVFRKRRDKYIIFPHTRKTNDPLFDGLRNVLGYSLTGQIPNTKTPWVIALEVSIERKFNTSLLMLTPTIIGGKGDPDSRFITAAFIKEKTARWYNSTYAKILDAWLEVIFGNEREIEVSTFSQSTMGFNPTFKLGRETPHSKTI